GEMSRRPGPADVTYYLATNFDRRAVRCLDHDAAFEVGFTTGPTFEEDLFFEVRVFREGHCVRPGHVDAGFRTKRFEGADQMAGQFQFEGEIGGAFPAFVRE